MLRKHVAERLSMEHENEVVRQQNVCRRHERRRTGVRSQNFPGFQFKLTIIKIVTTNTRIVIVTRF